MLLSFFSFFFFNDTATTEIYTLSLHDALPISLARSGRDDRWKGGRVLTVESIDLHYGAAQALRQVDRKSTRLNSSHLVISYAVFCLKKKKTNTLTVVAYVYTRLTLSRVLVRPV